MSNNPSPSMYANASSSRRTETPRNTPQNWVIRRQRSRRNMNKVRGRFNSRAGISSTRINEQGPIVATRSPMLTQVTPPPPPPLPSQGSCRRHSCNNSIPNVVDSTRLMPKYRPEGSRTPMIFDSNWKGQPSSSPNLAVLAAVSDQENETRIQHQGKSHGRGRIGRLETSLKGENVFDPQGSQETVSLQGAINREVAHLIPMYENFLESLFAVEIEFDENEIQKRVEDLTACLQAPQSLDNPFVNGPDLGKKENNNTDENKKEEEIQGRRNDVARQKNERTGAKAETNRMEKSIAEKREYVREALNTSLYRTSDQRGPEYCPFFPFWNSQGTKADDKDYLEFKRSFEALTSGPDNKVRFGPEFVIPDDININKDTLANNYQNKKVVKGMTTLAFLFKRGVIVAADHPPGAKKCYVGIPVEDGAKLMSETLLRSSHQEEGLSLTTMITGLDKKGCNLYCVDGKGDLCRGVKYATGSGWERAFVNMDMYYLVDMSVERATEIGKRAICRAGYKAKETGGFSSGYYIGPDGFEIMDEAMEILAIPNLPWISRNLDFDDHSHTFIEIGFDETVPSPSRGINPSVDGHSSNKSDKNAVENRIEETEGATNDTGAAVPGKVGTDQLDVEEECGFAGLIPYLENDDFEDLIKWPDEQFFSYPDPYGFDNM
ncbi:OLC1v1037002C1 [Oldenlandia corymbosa var. corymbosa]|uniref:OLC1v1037002C1 n=1 Tax=Oldenlandia corymbosa var. corymbosa TaxID=529605 RepID=A0AAV1D0A8_OLDCO|nr:OLC1v1037002C1 [Oldenlandia corymbosa var. corymbosa]